MNKIHKLKSEYPDYSYIAQTTTYGGRKGRFLGFDLGDNTQVGVFSQANSNTAHIVTRENENSNQEKIAGVIRKLQELGFSRY